MRAQLAGAAALTQVDLHEELARLHPLAHAWAVRCCRDQRLEADDVLHEAYMKVLDGRARFEGRSSFKTWLLGVIRHTAREHVRRGWLSVLRLERWWNESESDRTPTESPSDDRVAALRRAMAKLSTRQQEVLHLVFYQELTIGEAADVLAMPIGTARTHYERGKRRLRQLVTTAEDA